MVCGGRPDTRTSVAGRTGAHSRGTGSVKTVAPGVSGSSPLGRPPNPAPGALRRLAELPEHDAGGEGADEGASVAQEHDQFLKVLELQPVVECVAEAVGG